MTGKGDGAFEPPGRGGNTVTRPSTGGKRLSAASMKKVRSGCDSHTLATYMLRNSSSEQLSDSMVQLRLFIPRQGCPHQGSPPGPSPRGLHAGDRLPGRWHRPAPATPTERPHARANVCHPPPPGPGKLVSLRDVCPDTSFAAMDRPRSPQRTGGARWPTRHRTTPADTVTRTHSSGPTHHSREHRPLIHLSSTSALRTGREPPQQRSCQLP